MEPSTVGCSPLPDTSSGTHRTRSSHSSMPVDAATCLQQLAGDVDRDVWAAQQRAGLLQEEVDALLARIAEAQTASSAVLGENDPVLQSVEAIRRQRRE